MSAVLSPVETLLRIIHESDELLEEQLCCQTHVDCGPATPHISYLLAPAFASSEHFLRSSLYYFSLPPHTPEHKLYAQLEMKTNALAPHGHNCLPIKVIILMAVYSVEVNGFESLPYYLLAG